MMRMRVKCENNESDLEGEDYVEVHAEDSDTKQDISSKDELDRSEKCFFGKYKESKCRERHRDFFAGLTNSEIYHPSDSVWIYSWNEKT